MAGATYQPDALLYANQASAAAQIVPSIHATSGAGIVLQQYAAAQAASGLYKASNDSHQAHIQHISPLAHNQAHIQPHATQYQFQNQSHTHQAAARFMMPIPAYHNNVSTINHSSRQQPGDTGNLIQYLHDTHQLPNHQGGFAHPPLPQPQGLIMTSGNSSQDLAQLLASYTTKSVEQHPPQPWIGAPQSSQWPAVIPDQMHPIHPFKHALPGPPRRGCRYVYNKLYIKGLGFDINEHQLLSACSFAGTVVSVRIARDKSTGFSRGFGWVEFGSRVDADRAWDVLEGKALGGMGGNILRITYGDA